MTKRRIRILSVLDALFYGGDENRVLQLASNIDRSRFDFRVATLRPPDAEFDSRFGSIRGQFDEAGIPIIDLGKRRGQPLSDSGLRRHARRAALLAEDVSRIVRVVKRDGIDILDGHTAMGYLCTTVAGVMCNVPSLLTTYNVREAWSPRKLWAVAHQGTLAATGAIVTDSGAVAGDIREWMLRKNHPRVLVIPNGPPPPVPTRTEEEMRTSLGLKPRSQTRVIGQIATHVKGKGQYVLVDAAPAVIAKHPDVTFLLVGFERADEPGYTQSLRDRAAALGVADHFVIGPYQGHIGDVWQTIDIHAHPSMLDSLPNCIIEGMSLGKTAVVSDVAGVPTLVLDGETGLVTPMGDVAAVSNALIRVLDDPVFARDLGDAARKRYDGGYTAKHLARRMEAVFEDLVAKRKLA